LLASWHQLRVTALANQFITDSGCAGILVGDVAAHEAKRGFADGRFHLVLRGFYIHPPIPSKCVWRSMSQWTNSTRLRDVA